MAGIRDDWRQYVEIKAYDEAAFQAEMGRHISDRDVREILNSPDKHYCGHLTPLNFAASFKTAQIAVIAVRESIREKLGVGIGRKTIKQLQSFEPEKFVL